MQKFLLYGIICFEGFKIALQCCKRYINGIFKSLFRIFLSRCLLRALFLRPKDENEKYYIAGLLTHFLRVGRTCSRASVLSYDLYLLDRSTYDREE